MLCGVLAVKREDWYKGLYDERIYLGNVMGNLEGWLGTRSLRTLELRVQRQSANAGKLVAWLHDQLYASRSNRAPATALVQSAISHLSHASLQPSSFHPWLSLQMPNGYSPVLAIYMQSEKLAKALPGKLQLFHHATSLGGVESSIEWRVMSDPGADRTLMRISVGLEDWEDLRDDLLEGFRGIVGEAVEDVADKLSKEL
jgi:cystathionine beta-lyase/cystathionine gamma-synthase